MTVKDEEVDLGPYPRWNNPVVTQEFGTTETRFHRDDEVLVLSSSMPRPASTWRL